MMGMSVDRYSGDKIKLAELLEQAAPLADEMNLWFGGDIAYRTFTDLAAYLRRVHEEEQS